MSNLPINPRLVKPASILKKVSTFTEPRRYVVSTLSPTRRDRLRIKFRERLGVDKRRVNLSTDNIAKEEKVRRLRKIKDSNLILTFENEYAKLNPGEAKSPVPVEGELELFNEKEYEKLLKEHLAEQNNVSPKVSAEEEEELLKDEEPASSNIETTSDSENWVTVSEDEETGEQSVVRNEVPEQVNEENQTTDEVPERANEEIQVGEPVNDVLLLPEEENVYNIPEVDETEEILNERLPSPPPAVLRRSPLLQPGNAEVIQKFEDIGADIFIRLRITPNHQRAVMIHIGIGFEENLIGERIPE